MTISRWVVLSSLLAASFVCHQACAISMPPGSTVWMKFEGSAGPDNDGDDIAGSNQAGPAPPNGIPLTSATDANGTATGYAEILPDRVRTFIRGLGSSAFMHASFQDTYTVVGTAAGPFDITFELQATGFVRSIPFGSFGHAILVSRVQAEIGTFSPLSMFSGAPLNEGSRVTAFDAGNQAVANFPTQTSGIPFEHPVDITASYTKTGVNIGDVFDIAYGVNTSFSSGEIDLLNTGTVSFDLPPGVRLVSALAQSFIPEPSGTALLAMAMC